MRRGDPHGGMGHSRQWQRWRSPTRSCVVHLAELSRARSAAASRGHPRPRPALRRRQFRAPDMTVLRGWYLESPGARASVVLVHDDEGHALRRSLGLLTLQRDYLRRGFNVFAFDLRGRGESGGVRDTFGSAERLDVDAAVALRAPPRPRPAGGAPRLRLRRGARARRPTRHGLDATRRDRRLRLRARPRAAPPPLAPPCPRCVFDPACWHRASLLPRDIDAMRAARRDAARLPVPAAVHPRRGTTDRARRHRSELSPPR